MKYENNWESINSRPVPSWFEDAKFGIFIHWGLYSVPAFAKKGEYSEWYMYNLQDPNSATSEFHNRVYGKNVRYEDFVNGFKAEMFDADRWAGLFERSGAKYVNIVSKHHDGYCLYKSKYAWNWNTVDTGPHRDILMELKTALDKTSVRFGVYHSLYEWYHPLYLENPERFALEHLIPMLKEMIEKYQPATLFTDGEWEQESSVWHSTEFLQWLYNESSVKDYIVPNDRWGKGTRFKLGGNFTSEYGTIDGSVKVSDVEISRAFEECRGIGASFGFNRNEDSEDYLSEKQLIEMLCSLVSKGGNLLLNIGPAADGTIPAIMQDRLLAMGDWLRVNGEAIYGTRLYTKKETEGLYYTRKGDTVYAIVSRFPMGEIALEEIRYREGLRVKLMGCDSVTPELCENGGRVLIKMPPVSPDDVACKHLYTFAIS